MFLAPNLFSFEYDSRTIDLPISTYNWYHSACLPVLVSYSKLLSLFCRANVPSFMGTLVQKTARFVHSKDELRVDVVFFNYSL